MRDEKEDLLFVANVPPPWTGQGAIHKLLLEGEYSRVRLVHLPMLFSKTSASQGKISADKIVSLCKLIFATYRARLAGTKLLYFSPGGPVSSAVFRDGLYLLAVRPVMRSTILVYHSSGVAKYIESLPALLRVLMRAAFARVQVAVQLSPNSPPDGREFEAKQICIIPNALPDRAGREIERTPGPRLTILYMGVVATGKGVEDLLLAAAHLVTRQVPFLITVVGDFQSPAEEEKLRRVASGLPAGTVNFAGPLTGAAKDEVFTSHDVFCFPSFWHAETFPLVLIEALSFSMPVIASRWRGIPDLLGEDGSCGTLVDIHGVDQIAEAFQRFAADAELRRAQSHNARLRYLARFQVEQLFRAYDQAFNALL